MRIKIISFWTVLCVCLLVAACGGKKTVEDNVTAVAADSVPEFNSDSAFVSIQTQCDFGPRVMNSEAHDRCGAYIIDKFRSYGLTVTKQEATFIRYDGLKMNGYNIIAQINPQAKERILLAAHWDSRPWADNDPDEANWKTPVMAANDGASGVAVLLEMARVLSGSKDLTGGVDLVCFDAEDVGVPKWDKTVEDKESSWCLGAQYWAKNPHSTEIKMGVLLDMVGGQGAHFYREGYSMQYASSVVDAVWRASKDAGYSTPFMEEKGGYVTDDHLPVNQIAHIPMIDIIPYYPTAQSGFGDTWHTIEDTPENIDKNTLKAVGQTLLQFIYNAQ